MRIVLAIYPSKVFQPIRRQEVAFAQPQLVRRKGPDHSVQFIICRVLAPIADTTSNVAAFDEEEAAQERWAFMVEGPRLRNSLMSWFC